MGGWKDRIKRIAAGHQSNPHHEGRARSDLAKYDRDVLGPTFRDLIAEFNRNGFRAADARTESDQGATIEHRLTLRDGPGPLLFDYAISAQARDGEVLLFVIVPAEFADGPPSDHPEFPGGDGRASKIDQDAIIKDVLDRFERSPSHRGT